MGEHERHAASSGRRWHRLKDHPILVIVTAVVGLAGVVLGGIQVYQTFGHEEQTPEERAAQRVIDCRQDHDLSNDGVIPDELPGVVRGCTWPPTGGFADGYYELHIDLVHREDATMLDAVSKAYIVIQAPCERLVFRSSYDRGGTFEPGVPYVIGRGDVVSLDTGEPTRIPGPLSDVMPSLGAQSVAIIGGGAYELTSLICMPLNSQEQ